jgi:hypothetical protein
MSTRGRLNTDTGTVFLHLILLVSFVVLVATGLRIASDNPEQAWLSILDPVLPVEHLWSRHLVAGIAMASALVGYAVYVARARLSARVRLDVTRARAIWRGGETGWSALNVAVVWLVLAGLIAEIATGAAIFWGAGQTAVALHLWVTWMCLACVAAHVALHVAHGGVRYALKIFRPSRLRIPPPPPDFAQLLAEQLGRRSAPTAHDDAPSPDKPSLRAHPLATALLALFLAAGLAGGSEVLTRPVLTIVAIKKSEAPMIDGDLSDAIWSKARLASVMTTQGGDFGGMHQSLVEIRALHDGEFAYFAFTWDDPTRSLKHQPLVKTRDGWRVASTRTDLADEEVYHEDKFAVLVSPSTFPLIGAAIHLARKPLKGKPTGSTGRGLHYTLDGSILDVWQWRASHEGPNGHVDNCHFGRPREASAASDGAHYSGGFALDPGITHYERNLVGIPSSESIHPARLPKDLLAMTQAMGRISDASNESESEDARWWMSLAESRPYSATFDASIPIGTVIPGIIILEKTEKATNEIVGFGRWAAGRWTLELVRRLKTGSAYDVELKTGILMWVAVFDHAEKRHSRHLRPFRLDLK